MSDALRERYIHNILRLQRVVKMKHDEHMTEPCKSILDEQTLVNLPDEALQFHYHKLQALNTLLNMMGTYGLPKGEEDK